MITACSDSNEDVEAKAEAQKLASNSQARIVSEYDKADKYFRNGGQENIDKALDIYNTLVDDGQTKAMYRLYRYYHNRDKQKSDSYGNNLISTLYKKALNNDVTAQLELAKLLDELPVYNLALNGFNTLIEKTKSGDKKSELKLAELNYFLDNNTVLYFTDKEELRKRKFKLYKSLANKDTPEAYINMIKYSMPNEADKILAGYYVNAYKGYLERAKTGDNEAITKIVKMHHNEQIKMISYNFKAIDKVLVLEKEANAGVLQAQYDLIVQYKHDVEKWKTIIEDQAKKGDAKAQLLYAKLSSDPKKWYMLAAKNGNAEAQYALGKIYQNDKKFDKAIKCYEKAYAKGDASSAFNLGWIHKKYYKIDKKLASEWFQKGEKQFQINANNGDNSAKLKLASWYKRGIPEFNIEQNVDKAISLLTELSNIDYDSSSLYLYEIYQGRNGNAYKNEVKMKVLEDQLKQSMLKGKDEIKTLFKMVGADTTTIQSLKYWLEKAPNNELNEQVDLSVLLKKHLERAKDGDINAQLKLAKAYVNNTKKDYKKSNYWFQKAAAHANEDVFLSMREYYNSNRELRKEAIRYWYDKVAQSTVESDEKSEAIKLLKNM